jgi:hypothetical protein
MYNITKRLIWLGSNDATIVHLKKTRKTTLEEKELRSDRTFKKCAKKVLKRTEKYFTIVKVTTNFNKKVNTTGQIPPSQQQHDIMK